MTLPKVIKAKLQKGILSKKIEGGHELFSPIHGLTVFVSEKGKISGRDINLPMQQFIDQTSPCSDEPLRMYRQAFLQAPPLFSKINIELTKSCTLHCPHCFTGHGGVPAQNIFPLSLLTNIMDRNPGEISLTGGEIFLTRNIEDVIEEIAGLSERRILFRILANGSWIYNSSKVSSFFSFTEKTDADFQLRFTVFHSRPEIHDSVCGSAGHLKALERTVRETKLRGIPVYVNFPVTPFSFEERAGIVEHLNDLTGGSFTVSAIIYPSARNIRAAEKFSLSGDQLSQLLDEKTFRPLASAWCDPSEQCRYHCRFPLLGTDGRIRSCNLPGSGILTETGNGRSPVNENSIGADCSSCSAREWCKKCPSAAAGFEHIYCALARTAAEKVMEDFDNALARGFIPV